MPTSPSGNDDDLVAGVQDALQRAGITAGDTLLLAWSGGRDSTVLLDLLRRLATPLQLNLVAAHIDHAMRESSTRDAAHCEEQAHRFGLCFERVTLTAGQVTSQGEAREARYLKLAELALAHRARAVLTAHHGDDRLESALINLLRGSGLDGLATLQEDATLRIEHHNLRVLRPLLFASARQVADYARERNLTWVDDPTNATDHYLRNRIRQQVTPQLRAIAGELSPARRTLANLESEHEAAEHAANQLETRARRPALEPDTHAFDAHLLLSAPRALCFRVILRIAPAFDRETLERIAALLPDAFSITPKHLSAPGFLVRASHGRLTLLPARQRGGRDRLHPTASPIKIAATPRGALDWQGSHVRWSILPRAQAAPDHPARPWRCLLPAPAAHHPLTLRGYLPGDTLTRTRQDGTPQKIKASAVFQAARIGADTRWCWPCVADASNDLIWIAGLSTSFPPDPTHASRQVLEVIVRPSAALSAILQWQRK
ncbi:tRNA lysidine(34) synthetase TilS [Lujinxingia vulgaris]|uniref:tRNA(Ile)-lysidine synthase n=1 Tax=Lujinxingia vulgaris TaxID=2600176 RepID=A0A5C6XB01_9DELT|nr:tRNA lysidine(34) synthetase TilS [Lujinxingia vulgaris]TXD38516.1 tRNA lysidine(34) synthetase TilS [Lujinxingia vulgaris]